MTSAPTPRGMRSSGLIRLVTAAALMLWPGTADAHLVQTGFGTFYDGVAHVVLTPEDLLVVLATALLAGLRGRTAARGSLFALSGAWLVGGVAGAWLPSNGTLPWATTLSFGALGVLVALDAKIPPRAVVALACAAGLFHGFVNGRTLAPGGADALGICGVVSAVFVVVALVAAPVLSLRAAWTRVAVRVAGSWIAASGLLMLGWLLRPAL